MEMTLSYNIRVIFVRMFCIIPEQNENDISAI